MNSRGWPAVCGIAIAAACWGGSESGSTTSGPTTKQVVAPREPVAFELEVVDRAGYDAAIARLRGKVVLVDCWASWCLPCVEQMPHTIALARRLRDAGLAVVMLSLDDPSDTDAVRAVLVKNGATAFTNLISQFGTSSESAKAFEIPGGALPQYMLYDRTGKLRRTFALDPAAEKQFTPQDVVYAVDELLAE
jgi:thiol-disulfide isomerase/thioredoxin